MGDFPARKVGIGCDYYSAAQLPPNRSLSDCTNLPTPPYEGSGVVLPEPIPDNGEACHQLTHREH